MTRPLPDAPGDERQERFLALFLPEQSSLRALIRAAVWDRIRCDDVFQEVALVLWRELDRYDSARPFGAWARGVAIKTVLKTSRDARRSTAALSLQAVRALENAFAEAAHGELHLSTTSRAEALRRCLQRLPERSQVLIRLRYGDALNVNEIASKVRSSPDAVHKALTRVRGSLAKCVERRLRVETNRVGHLAVL